MATSANVLSDNSLLSRLDHALYRVERVLALISGLTIENAVTGTIAARWCRFASPMGMGAKASIRRRRSAVFAESGDGFGSAIPGCVP